MGLLPPKRPLWRTQALRLRRDEGQALVEYALLMLLMVFVSIGILELLGLAVLDLFTEAGDAVSGAVGG